MFPGRSAFRVVSKPAYESLYSIFLAVVCFRCHQSIFKGKNELWKSTSLSVSGCGFTDFLMETVKAVKSKQTVDIFLDFTVINLRKN